MEQLGTVTWIPTKLTCEQLGSLVEILLSYKNLLGTAPWLKGLNVPPQHDGGGVAQKYIGVPSLETWYG